MIGRVQAISLGRATLLALGRTGSDDGGELAQTADEG